MSESKSDMTPRTRDLVRRLDSHRDGRLALLIVKRTHGGQPAEEVLELVGVRRERRRQRLEHDARRGSQPSRGLDVHHPAARDGGGLATARSCTSKIIDIAADIAIISPLIRQSFLLSSSTVFMLDPDHTTGRRS